MTNNRFVAYIAVSTHSNHLQMLMANQQILRHEQRINEFISQFPQASLIKKFIGLGAHHRNRHRWSELENAVNFCIDENANLILSEINGLTSNESFTKHLIRLIETNESSRLYCCDQPFIHRDNFKAIAEHAQLQKQHHGQLIKQGLARSHAKSGNPHATDVINKVNKPKIDASIVYALLLQPVIADYQERALSQRKMVETLNSEGFFAPEGGKWVLSQLQKVLERIKMNEMALLLEQDLKSYQEQNLTHLEIAAQLNMQQKPSIKPQGWDEQQVVLLQERIVQLHNIVGLHDFTIELIPILDENRIDQFDEKQFENALRNCGVQVPKF